MKKPTRREVIEAQCWECLGHYSDGKIDCENTKCPIYEYMPYRKLKPDFNVFKYNHRHCGKKLKSETTRKITDEQRKELSERLKKARKK